MKKPSPVVLLFVLAAILRLTLAFLAPLYPTPGILPGYNDEPLHLYYVHHLASFGVWPIWGVTADSSEVMAGELTQPPLYYALAASPYKWAEALHEGWGKYGARLVSVIFGLIGGLFLYRGASLWFRDKLDAGNTVPLATLAAFLLTPNAVVFTSLVSNDALLICLSAISLYSIIRMQSGETGTSRQLLTGVFIAAAVWAKMSGLVLIPLIWFVAPSDWERGEKWSLRLRVLAVALMLVLPLVAWNLAQYGRIIPFTPGYEPEKVMGVAGGAVLHPLMAAKLFLRTAAQPFDTVWGPTVEKMVSLVWVVIFGGLSLFGGCHLARNRVGGIFFAMAGLAIAAFIFHNINMFQVEFRLLASAFPALAIFAAVGATATRLSLAAQAMLYLAPITLWLSV